MRFFFAASLALWFTCLAFSQPRTPWTRSNVQGSPEPPPPFVHEEILKHLKFAEGLELSAVTGTGKLLLVERFGKIYTFNPKGDKTEKPHLVVDLKQLQPELENAFGIALHPKYRENREIFVAYALKSGRPDGTHLSRFKLSSLDPLTIDPSTEEILLTWLSGEHNGASIQFGPDGYLYVSTGDGAPPAPPDLLLTGQDTSDLLSAILRIDIDHRDPPLAYRIPPDNPWADGKAPSAPGLLDKPGLTRPEHWAFGLRNPFKMSFDRVTGNLWCGDVGWELWEMIFLIKRGGNYGWSAYEASQPIVPSRASPLAPITAPIVAHDHSEAASITGGYVYHGKEFPELVGAYVYGDWATGKIWALWYDGEKVTRHEEIADTPHNIVTFGQDDDGEIYYLQFSNPTSIHRLKRNPQAGQPSSFPRSLSETGVFADIKTLTPAPGVYPFSITQPLWEDGAVATQRLIGLKGESHISTTVVVYPEPNSHRKKIDYSSRWPAGAVLARTITLGDLALTTAERSRRVETQLLHFDGQAWNAYTYRWNDAQTDASLVPASGEEATFRVRPDPQAIDQEVRDYRWRFQSRAECLRCHNTWNNGALAFSPAQLQGVPGKQSQELVALGLIHSDYLEHTRAGLNPENTVNGAARAVFHANCAHCHRSDAGGAVSVYLNTELLTAQMNVVDVEPAQGGLGLKNPKLIEPGDPWSSVIAVRIAKSGVGHMPLIGAKETDVKGLKAIEDWIARMTSTSTAPKPWDEVDWTEALITRELQTVNGAMRVRRAIDDSKLSIPLRRHAFQLAWASPETTVRDIFERFKPDALREKTLGSQVNVAELLAMRGDAVRGSRLFTPEGKGASCLACHFVQGQGRHFGPDLTKIGAQQSAAQILESILHPSKLIAPEYRATIVELRDGSSQMGFVSRRDAREVVLKIPSGDSVTLKVADIAAEKSMPQSLMPEGQLMGFTAQEAADLIAYLGSLGR